MSSRYHLVLSFRLTVAHRAKVVRIAARRGLSISSLIKEALRPYIDGVDDGVDAQSVISPIAPRVAPANRALPEAPIRQGGFTERKR